MLINGMYDDISAIIDTAVNEYQLLWRLPAAIICGIILVWILCKFLDTRTYKIKFISKNKRWLYSFWYNNIFDNILDICSLWRGV